jgi:hypothetical protein
MNKNSNPTWKSRVPYKDKTWAALVKRSNRYNLENSVTGIYNYSLNKCIDVEGLTGNEISLYLSKVEDFEVAEKLEIT